MSKVMDRVQQSYSGMSKSHKRIVHFLKDHQEDLAFDSLAVFSKKAGSSEATVVRFARLLGFAGFSDLQKTLQGELVAQAKGPNPVPARSENAYAACADLAHEAMLKTYQSLDSQVLQSSCEILMEADRVLIIGYMDSFGVAAQALHLLDMIRPRVDFSRLLFETQGVFRHLHPGTAVLVVSFEPHYMFTYEMTQLARQRGCKIVLLTDSPLNPLSPLADQILCARPVPYRGERLLDVSAPIHLLTMMVRYMMDRWSDEVEQYMATSPRLNEEYLE